MPNLPRFGAAAWLLTHEVHLTFLCCQDLRCNFFRFQQCFFSDFVFMFFFFVFGKFFKGSQSVLRFFSQLLQPAQFAKIDYGTGGAAKVLRNAAKKWLFKQALGQIFLPALNCIPWPKFNLPTPNLVHQADLLFLPHDNLPRGRKFLYMPSLLSM